MSVGSQQILEEIRMTITNTTYLKLGSKGTDVKAVQLRLNALGIKDKYGKQLVVDGSFGGRTESAVINYQDKMKLQKDGIAGPITLRSLGLLNSTSTPTPVKTATKTDTSQVYSVPSYKYEKQDTAYTCGPSSSVMALSEMGINTTEATMATLEETTKNGTGHTTLISGIRKAGTKAGVTLLVSEAKFLDVGWQKLAEWIRDPKIGVICHGICAGWKYYTEYKGGHYAFPISINMATRTITIADPARGILVYTFDEFKKGLDLLSQPSLIVIRK